MPKSNNKESYQESVDRWSDLMNKDIEELYTITERPEETFIEFVPPLPPVDLEKVFD